MADKKKILVVDDEPDILRWLTVLLENNGYDVVNAVDGLDGIEKARKEAPDLITLDISMPKDSGVKMFRDLHDSEDLSGIPVIMLTGVTPDFEKFISSRKQVAPPAAYFEKPVDEKELLAKIKELVG